MSLLVVENLRVTYFRDGVPLPALRGVTFSLSAGESLGLAGESGSGKSTLAVAPLRLLPDNARLSADRLVFDGRDLMAASPRDLRALRGGAVGTVFQDPFSSLNPVPTCSAARTARRSMSG